MLHALSNRPHRVMTAIAIGWGDQYAVACSESWVTFAEWSEADIEAYVASGEPMGKAGAYAVQGRAAAYIAHISGSYSGIMGLPLFETAQALRSLGLCL
jgi:septum formation protein